jgi:hypothetical protein
MRVALVSMPFYPSFSAGYQIEYLAAALRQSGHHATAHHAHYDFGRRLVKAGFTRLYDDLVNVRYLGDYLVLARSDPSGSRAVLAEMLDVIGEARRLTRDELVTFYSAFNDTVADLVERIGAEDPDIVGLSSTHYQLVASLFAARRLRDTCPRASFVLGGYLSSVETARDLVAMHPYLDVVVYGQADDVDAVFGGIHAGHRGLMTPPPEKRLRATPEYVPFAEAGPARDGLLQHMTFSFEASRGCYWDRCDFCNFNAAYGRFRSFKPSDVVGAMDRLAERLAARRFQLLDTSLPPSFANHVKGFRRDYDVFVEVMADLRRDHFAALRNFGVRRAQVGIESLSSSHLRAMCKHTGLTDNLQALRTCLEFGIEPVYGMLVGRPGDEPAHYRESAAVARRVHHLPPPRYVSECDLRPGSPIFQIRHELGCSISFTHGSWDAVLPAKDHNCELRPSMVRWRTSDRELAHARDELEVAINEWRDAWHRGPPVVSSSRQAEGWRVSDGRTGRVHSISSTELAALASLCVAPAKTPLPGTERLVHDDLVLLDEGKAVSLVSVQ